MSDNPFEEYYNQIHGVGEDKPKPIDDDADTKKDAKEIKESINKFIKNLNKLITDLLEEEKKKGTRTDLIVTVVVGGLAFSLANVFYLVTKELGAGMDKEEYEETFVKMFRSALEDIKRHM